MGLLKVRPMPREGFNPRNWKFYFCCKHLQSMCYSIQSTFHGFCVWFPGAAVLTQARASDYISINSCIAVIIYV